MIRLKLWLGAALAGLAMLWAAWIGGKRDGHVAAKSKAMQKDRDNARRIEDAADAARGDDSNPIKRLRDAGRLRD